MRRSFDEEAVEVERRNRRVAASVVTITEDGDVDSRDFDSAADTKIQYHPGTGRWRPVAYPKGATVRYKM